MMAAVLVGQLFAMEEVLPVQEAPNTIRAAWISEEHFKIENLAAITGVGNLEEAKAIWLGQQDFEVSATYINGQLVAEDGKTKITTSTAAIIKYFFIKSLKINIDNDLYVPFYFFPRNPNKKPATKGGLVVKGHNVRNSTSFQQSLQRPSFSPLEQLLHLCTFAFHLQISHSLHLCAF